MHAGQIQVQKEHTIHDISLELLLQSVGVMSQAVAYIPAIKLDGDLPVRREFRFLRIFLAEYLAGRLLGDNLG